MTGVLSAANEQVRGLVWYDSWVCGFGVVWRGARGSWTVGYLDMMKHQQDANLTDTLCFVCLCCHVFCLTQSLQMFIDHQIGYLDITC
jgi:hypothetical protein